MDLMNVSNAAFHGDVPMLKAVIRDESGGDKVLAESIYKKMLSAVRSNKLIGLIALVGGIPALLLLFVGIIPMGLGLYLIFYARKRRAVIEQAYAEWKSESS